MLFSVICFILFFLFIRALFVIWYSLCFVHSLPQNPRIALADFTFLQPGTLILTRIGTTPFSVNHLSLALTKDHLFECMTTKKKRVKYHFFSYHVDYILPKLVQSAKQIAIRQPLQPLSEADIKTLAQLYASASTLGFNYFYEVDLFRHRIFGAKDDDGPQLKDIGCKSFCSQLICLFLRTIHRTDVKHNWSLPSEFSSQHPNDILKNYYSQDAILFS